MEVQLTRDQTAFIREAIESGRLLRAEDAVQQAMSLWEERERRRMEILVAVDKTEASLARGGTQNYNTGRSKAACRGHKAARRGAAFQ